MIVKINGTPVEDIARDLADVIGTNAKLAYGAIHTPINMEVTAYSHKILNIDANVFNIPHHAFAAVKPHVVTAFEYLF